MDTEEIGNLTDEEIVCKVQSGKKEQFGFLVTRYEEKMKRYAKKFLFGYEDAEDIIQEVFLKAYINIQSFDASRKFSSWLYRIAHNEFINAIKKRGKEPLPFFNFDILLPGLVAKNGTDDDLNKKELNNILKKCLDKISPKYREPVVLYYIEELSYKEIADVLRIPTSTVGVRIKRGKEAMKKIYKKIV